MGVKKALQNAALTHEFFEKGLPPCFGFFYRNKLDKFVTSCFQ